MADTYIARTSLSFSDCSACFEEVSLSGVEAKRSSPKARKALSTAPEGSVVTPGPLVVLISQKPIDRAALASLAMAHQV